MANLHSTSCVDGFRRLSLHSLPLPLFTTTTNLQLQTMHRPPPSLGRLRSSSSKPATTITTPRSMKDNSMSSILTDLEREQEPSKLVPPEKSKLLWPAERWRDLAGEGNWAGLLDPMDPFLRSVILRYGEMTQACYDSFDFDPCSKYCGSCKYNRRYFFDSLGMHDSPYAVTRYLYAIFNLRLPNFSKTSRWSKKWSQSANWMGYVAVSDDKSLTRDRLGRRDIAIAWRGTVTRVEWLADLTTVLKPVESGGVPCIDSAVKVESGFLELYTDRDQSCRFGKYSAREQILAEVRRLVHMYTERGEEVSITVMGHSLGGALAILSAFDIAETGANVGVGGQRVPISVYTFGGPRVGNFRFKQRLEERHGVRALRVVNVHDTVPKVPGVLVNETLPAALRKLAEVGGTAYEHVGVELKMDSRASPFLKETSDAPDYHNLEAYLHLVDGYHGKSKGKIRFESATGRDPALVNKSSNFLRDEYLVPPNWRQDENKGMVRTEDGRWVQPERPKIDDHPEDMHHHLRELGI